MITNRVARSILAVSCLSIILITYSCKKDEEENTATPTNSFQMTVDDMFRSSDFVFSSTTPSNGFVYFTAELGNDELGRFSLFGYSSPGQYTIDSPTSDFRFEYETADDSYTCTDCIVELMVYDTLEQRVEATISGTMTGFTLGDIELQSAEIKADY